MITWGWAIAAWAGPDAGPVSESTRGDAASEPVALAAFSRGRVSRLVLEDMVEAIAPLVEGLAGRRFTHIPDVVVADVTRIERVLYEEQIHLLRSGRGLSPDAARKQARTTVAQVGSTFVGKYGFLDHNLYIVPTAVRVALADEGLDPELENSVLELVVAHELTHALQDQHANLDETVIHQSGNDAVMALNCLVEGHAVWVHEQVGAARGRPEAVAAVARILGYDLKDTASSPAPRIDPTRYYTSYVYGQGRAFVDHHARAGGSELVWTILANPPIASAMIVHPASYGAAADPMAERTRHAIRRGRDALVEPDWALAEEVLGDYDLRERLMNARAPALLADRIVGGWSSRGAPDEGFAGAEVELLHFDGPDAAWSYVEAMHANAATLLAVATHDAEGAIVGTVGLWDRMPNADLAAREIIGLTLLDGQQLSTHWVARGPYVVQVVLVNAPPSERRVAAQINRVLRSVE